MTHVFPDAVAHQTKLTDLCAVVRGRARSSLLCTITLNDKPLVADHDPAAAPVHVDLPGIAKGDRLVITLREAEGLPVNFSFFCRVETERFGLIPRAPLNHDRLGPLDKTLALKQDNEYDMHFANVYAGEMIILNANNAFPSEPEAVRSAMRESIRIVREKAPDARIVILGVVRDELFQSAGGYMTPEGYQLWTEILVPDLEWANSVR